MGSIDQQRFEDMRMATVPNADLTYEAEGVRTGSVAEGPRGSIWAHRN